MTPLHADARRGLTLERDAFGVVHVRADRRAELYWGMGYAHALDRGVQMVFMRTLGQGRAAELLDGSDKTVAIDAFFRRMNWGSGLEAQRSLLPPDAALDLDRYCEGVAAGLARRSPWELRLLGIRPEPWRPEDTLLLSRMAGYLTLAQSQAEIERLLVQMVQAGVPRAQLDELFPGALDLLDVELVAKVRLGDRIVPDSIPWGGGGARLMSSNNWVVSGARTASGKPIMANDPHLEINRLPAVWYEIVLSTRDRYCMGATMPGIAAVLIGRTTDVAWGGTYTFMDAVDSWVEDCRDGKYRRGADEWVPFRTRREVVRRKGRRPPVEIELFENDHGVLDGDPRVAGHYLATRWSGAEGGAVSLAALQAMWGARDVEEGMAHLGAVEMAFNWVLADRHGNIGYQMSGRMPKRRAGWSGLPPVAGWDAANDWQGFVAPDDLPRCLNPPEGLFVTANDDLNRFGRAAPINACQGPHRARRIARTLAAIDRLTAEDCRRIQMDLGSEQAPEFLEILRPLLPDSPAGRALAEWDGRYDADSRGAALFEAFYDELRRSVFGPSAGPAVLDFLGRETGVFADFFACFDRVMLSPSSSWFGERSRDEIFREAAARALAAAGERRWGDGQREMQRHILFGGKLPSWLGFDRGPVTIPGGRATIHQGQIYRSAGRTTSFAPSIRIVADLADPGMRTCLAGGPSEQRFSRWYWTDMPDWSAGRLKELVP